MGHLLLRFLNVHAPCTQGEISVGHQGERKSPLSADCGCHLAIDGVYWRKPLNDLMKRKAVLLV